MSSLFILDYINYINKLIIIAKLVLFTYSSIILLFNRKEKLLRS